MRFSAMSPRDRRALVLGAAVLAPAFFFMWGVRPYLAALSDTRQRLVVEREALARERAAVSAARRNPNLQHVADSATRSAAPRLFAGRDDVMASAELASYLGDVARRHHVWLQDASTRAATTAEGGVRTLHVDIRAESDLRGILEFLKGLEAGAKLVRVDRLDISRQPSRSDENGAETLAMSATVAGFAIPEEQQTGVRNGSPESGTSPRSSLQNSLQNSLRTPDSLSGLRPAVPSPAR